MTDGSKSLVGGRTYLEINTCIQYAFDCFDISRLLAGVTYPLTTNYTYVGPSPIPKHYTT